MRRTLDGLQNPGIQIVADESLVDLEYADDIVLIFEDQSEAQALSDKLTTIIQSFGMRLSPSRCKFMLQNVPSANISLTLQGESMEIVEKVIYRGSCINSDGSVSEFNARISKVRIAFANLHQLGRQKGISLDFRGRVYQATVRAVLLYGCETWPLRGPLQVFDHRCVVTLDGVSVLVTRHLNPRKYPASSNTMARSCATHAETPSAESSVILCASFEMAQTARSFLTKSGVRQGCALSPFLFNFLTDETMGRTPGGVQITAGENLVNVVYADDIVLIFEDEDEAQALLNKLNTIILSFGMMGFPCLVVGLVEEVAGIKGFSDVRVVNFPSKWFQHGPPIFTDKEITIEFHYRLTVVIFFSQVFSLLQDSAETETLESKDSLSPSVNITLRQIHFAKPSRCTCNQPSSQSSNVVSRTFTGAPQAPFALIYVRPFSFTEPIPELCRSCSGRPMLPPEDIVVFDELFSMWRWLLVFTHHHSNPSAPKKHSLSLLSLSTLLRYLFQEWGHIITRIEFQNEATTWKQLRGLHNYFGVFAAALLLIYDDDVRSSTDNPHSSPLALVEDLASTISSRSDNDGNCKRTRVIEENVRTDPEQTNLWALLIRLVSSADKGGSFCISLLTTGSRDPNRPGRGDGFSSKARLRTQDRLAHDVLLELLHIVTLPKFQTHFGHLRRVISRHMDIHFTKLCDTAPEYFTYPVPWRLRLFVFCGHLLPELQLARTCATSAALTAFNPALSFFINQLSGSNVSMDEESATDHLKRLLTLLFGTHLSSILTFHQRVPCGILKHSSCELSYGFVIHRTVAISVQQLATAIEYICQTLAKLPLMCEPYQLDSNLHTLRALILLAVIWSHLSHVKAHVLHLTHAEFNNLLPSSIVEILFRKVIQVLFKNPTSSKKRTELTSETFVCEDSNTLLLIQRSFAVLLKHVLIGECSDSGEMHPYWEQLIHSVIQKPVPFCLKSPNTPTGTRTPHLSHGSRFGDDEFLDCVPASANNLETDADESTQEKLLESEKQEQETNMMLLSAVVCHALRIRSSSLVRLLQCRFSQVFSNSVCDTAESIDWLCTVIDNLTRSSKLSVCSLMFPCSDVTFDSEFILLFSCLVDAIRESLKVRLARISRVKCISQLVKLIRCSCQLTECTVRQVRNQHKKTSKESDNLQRWYSIGQHLDQLNRTVWSVVAKHGTHLLCGLGQVAIDCVRSWFKVRHRRLRFGNLERTWALNRRPLSLEQCITFSSTGSSSSSSCDMTLHIHRLIHSILVSVSGLPVSDCQRSDPCEEPHSSMTLHIALSCFVQSCIQLTDLCSTSGRGLSTEIFQVRPYLLPLVLTGWLRSKSSFEQDTVRLLSEFPWKCWGLDNWSGSSSSPQSDLVFLVLSRCNPKLVEVTCAQRITDVPYIIGTLAFDEHRLTGTGSSNLTTRWSALQHQIGGSEMIRQLFAEPSTVATVVEHILRLLALYQSADNPAPSSTHSYDLLPPYSRDLVLCLCRLATRLELVKTDPFESKHPSDSIEPFIPALCSLFASSSQLPAFRIFSSYFEKSKLLCCPALLRYQNWNLNQLQDLLVKFLAPGSDVVPIDQLEFSVGARHTQLQQTAAAICQSFSVSAHELCIVLTTLYERISYALFSPAFESFRDELTPVLIDRATRAAGLKCLSLLKRLLSLLSQMEVEVECSWATKDDSLLGSNEFSVVNPVNRATWRCFLGTAHLAAFCNSSSASIASQVLHRLFGECSCSLDPLLSNSHASNSMASLSTMLLPYFSVRNTGRNTTNFTEAQLTVLQQLSELTRTEIVQFVVDHVKLTVSSSSAEGLASEQNWPVPFILWLLSLPLTLSPIYKALQPLLPVSPSLCKQIFPWLILSVFTATDELSASVSEALKLGLADGIAWSLKQSSVCRSIEDLWIDSLLALHTWEQWTRTNSGSPPEWITSHSTRRRVWLGICRLFADLPGLRTAQIAFLAPCQSTDDCEVQALASDPTAHPMFKETSVAVNELCNNWDRLLGWYDCSLPSSSSARLNLAACLHRMAAYNLAQCVFDESIHEPTLESAGDILTTRSSSSKYFSQLQELRAATAWRLGHWSSSATKAVGPPPTSWSECGMETSFYWIVEAIQRHDWAQVETIASSLWQGLLDDLNKQLSTSFDLFHEISSSSQQISCLERFAEVARSLSVNGLPEALLQWLNGLFNEISHMVDSVASQSSLVDSLIATGSLEPLEPFLTSSLRLVSALLMQLSNRSETPITRSRAFGLLEHTYFEAAESALMTGELRLVDHWLQDVALYRAMATNPESRQPSDCEQTLLVSQAWRELRSAELVAQLSFYRGEKHISVSHLYTGLETAMHVLNRPLEHCALLVRRGFIGAYMHCVTTLCSWLFASRSKSAGDLLTNYLEPVLNRPLEHCALLVRRGFIGAYMHCVTTLCSWLFASRSKSAGDLLTNYLEPAMTMARRWEATVDPEALANLAQFADSQFTTLDSYLASPEFATRRQLLTEAQRDVECLTDLGEKSRLLRILQRQSALEVEELEAFTSDADRYLEASLDAYAQCLALSDSHDLQIYRLISLWFSAAADPSVQSCPNARARMVNRIMAERLSAIRSDKFLPLIPQLAVRLSCAFLSNTEASVGFQTTLTELVERIVDGHPHHAAFTLLFLVNAELDDVYTADSTTGLQRVTSAAQRSRQTRLNDTNNRMLSQNQTTEQNSRIQAARRLYARLLEGRRGPLLQQMQSLAEAYVEWANFNVDKHRGSTADINSASLWPFISFLQADIPFPSGCMLHRFAISPRQRINVRQGMDALSLVAIPTDVLRIDRSGQYDRSNVVCISGFAPTFRLAGGINMPKIVTCWGTDGRSRRQLVKGRDDPRQDAVMQQVFAAANRLFYQRRRQSRAYLRAATNAATPCDFSRCRWLDADGGLRVRTYKVIPMAQRSGVIEWCEGTVPLGEWLAADRSGAHQRYRPKDLPPGQAKQRLAAVRDRPYERRLAVFDEICQKLKYGKALFCSLRLPLIALLNDPLRFGQLSRPISYFHLIPSLLVHSPVLAYFYLEHFPDPQQWCRARYAYTRSLAASSLVGYLVGLGDRHPHNLLLHRASGELVHIDLGVAFDQVLLYDPLYSWSMTPAQLCALEARRAENTSTVYQVKPGTSVLSDQTNIPGKTGRTKTSDGADRSLMNSTSECGTGRLQPTREPLNQLAERVLLNVRSKLEGRVTGNMASASSDQRKCAGLDQLDVSGHVGMLVRAATDRTQLARMYFGWQAYL
ncbi:hypothetical protein T265_00205 [Opisthorchis viverrini]|uniref:non-specific serine/threonine protein kinase n=1 Tax=Opisthorchis viverrini TaxID=6198 RepID=A0A075AD54_OPIVI|nr:hypothetical protein T265_00205 [Opisthorchis viverrini]KER34015.1 hypothetical protein T265_00205 [Opisthorchis viverrini]